MTHTKGPWITGYKQKDDDPGIVMPYVEKPFNRPGIGKIICEMGGNQGEDYSNARLIAAAPQQNKVLKVALSLVDLIAGYAEDMPAEVLTTALATGQQIEQAIDLAEGGE